MADLSHWNYAGKFSGREIAALILGREPVAPSLGLVPANDPTSVVFRRLESEFLRTVDAYLGALKENNGQPIPPNETPTTRLLPSLELRSMFSAPKNLVKDALLPLSVSSMKSDFERQAFSRADVRRWIEQEGLRSAYDFADDADNTLARMIDASPDDVDPSDMPEELQAANIAYRAVLKGYGRPGETFRNRLVTFLEERYQFSEEAVKRIATVANADKSSGRKRRED